MKLAIDVSRAGARGRTGIGWYTVHLVNALKDVIPDTVGVVLYSDRELPDDLLPLPDHWKVEVLPWPGVRGRSKRDNPSDSQLSTFNFQLSKRWPLWSQVRLAWQVLRDRPDVLFIPAHVIPLALAWKRRLQNLFPISRLVGGRGGVGMRIVTTIHDVVFKDFPETYSPRERRYANFATGLALRCADSVIVPTRSVANDLARYYGTPRAQIVAIHHGVDSIYFSIGNRPVGKLLLYAGRIENKKNTERLVEAFEQVADIDTEVQLVLVGSDGFGSESTHARVRRSRHARRIRMPGWVSTDAYRNLLGIASAFVFPTLGEGFGLPILEAMAAGVPVITSRGGVHEEIAGDAAILVDPLDVDAIARGMHEILRKENALRLSECGRARARQFSWSSCAEQTWSVLQK
ncbi:MAG: glycosyltransferase family 1 protein [Candidatus Uhrbacteria bacterium]